MFKFGFVFVAVVLCVFSIYAADLLMEELDSLMEYSNGNLKDRGNDSETTGEDDESREDNGSGDQASSSKQEQGYDRFLIL